jgi:hypothetical protein
MLTLLLLLLLFAAVALLAARVGPEAPSSTAFDGRTARVRFGTLV